LARVCVILTALKVSPTFYTDLMSLSAYEIVLVLDDSGSMATATSKGMTRWKELQEVARIAIEIGCALDANGVDITFLNRAGAENVRTWAEAEHLFRSPPHGGAFC
jgi:hypothetical protein